MKKTVTTLLLFTFLSLGFVVPKAEAQMGSMMGFDGDETEVSASEEHAESVEVVLQNILSSQNVRTVQELDLSKVSDDEWERLGDAVMELQHPGEAHEAMDRMMGGEGSDSLRQMHIAMGQAYLGYGSNTNYGPGMMGRGMMGYTSNRTFNGLTNVMGFGSMMGYGSYSFLGTATWIVAIAFFTSGTYFFLKQAHKK